MGTLYIAGESVKWYSFCKTSLVVLQKVNTEVLYDPAISIPKRTEDR